MKGITWNVESLTVKHRGYPGSSVITAEIEGLVEDREEVARVWPTRSSCQYGLSNILNGYQNPPKIQKVIFNNPATIILWTDGTKTVVKCQPGDIYDKEKGFAMAYLKKLLGNDNTFNKEINKWVEEETRPVVKLNTRKRISRRIRDVLIQMVQMGVACVDEVPAAYRDAIRKELEMARSKSTTNEEEGCKVCRAHKDKILRKYAIVYGHSLGNFTHCPYCGRKLKEESK